MGYMNVGTIDYKGVIRTIWVGSDAKLATASWAQQQAKYFSDYTGPPPSGLPSSAPDKPIENKRDLF